MTDPKPWQRQRRLDCPCGERIAADNDDELVRKTQEHLAARHPDLDYGPDEILFLAY